MRSVFWNKQRRVRIAGPLGCPPPQKLALPRRSSLLVGQLMPAEMQWGAGSPWAAHPPHLMDQDDHPEPGRGTALRGAVTFSGDTALLR